MHGYDREVGKKHVHTNENNKNNTNTRRNFKTQNTLGMPKTRKESLES